MKSIAVGLAMLVGLAGCGWFGPGASPPSSPATHPTENPTRSRTANPAASPPASPSSPAAAGPTPSTETTAPEQRLALPPDAILTVPDGSRHVGTVGTFTLDDHGTDAPWLPASALPRIAVTGQEDLTVSFADGTPIGFWQAVYAAAADLMGETTRGLGEREAELPPLDDVTFTAPPPGEWVVSVRLRFADGRGDATFYWHLAVE